MNCKKVLGLIGANSEFERQARRRVLPCYNSIESPSAC